MERVIVYVDGFNLYFGMMEGGFSNCRWLDIQALALNLLARNQTLIEVKYFTSRVSNNPDKQKRQSTYLEALYEVGVKYFMVSISLTILNVVDVDMCGLMQMKK